MSKDVSIAFKASDNLTHSVQSMRKSVGGLSRDVSEYRKIQSQAFDKRTEVKFDMTKAKQELKELEKAVKENVSGSEQAFKEKQRALEDLQEEYRRLSQAAKEASKAEKQLMDDMNKSKNFNKTMEGQQSSWLKSIASAGLAGMIGNAFTGRISQEITSMFGVNTGSMINGVVGGAATGAALGSVAGPAGIAIGAAVGGLAGGITSGTEKRQRQDENFTGEVQRIYQKFNEEQEESLVNGRGLAAKRETDMISYGTLLGGAEHADKFLKDIQQFSAKTPFEMNDLLDTSKVLLSYKYKQEEIIPFMTKIGDASSALDIDKEGQNVVATALGRMKSSGKTSLEYINQLSERAIPAIDYLAEALGKSNKEIYEMISKGTIDGAKASQIIVDAMGKEFEGNMAKQSETYSGLVSTLSDSWAQLDSAMGKGYTEKRKEGIEQELGILNGPMREEMEKAYSLIGEFQADLENQHQKSIVDAINNAMKTSEFSEAEAAGDGAKMGEIIFSAKTEAEVNYQKGEGMQKLRESQMNVIQNIQEDVALNNEYLIFGEKMAEKFSEGYASVIEKLTASGLYSPQVSELTKEHGTFVQKFKDKFTGNGTNTFGGIDTKSVAGYATGLDRVPRNDMLVRVHEGERIKTKVQADQEDNAKVSGGVNINIASMTVREEADIEKVANLLYMNLAKHSMNTSMG
ncbi:tape measure protein [Niameybacter massiliensis]|uniref:tape measure protein n=1 Tax=Niameybacter massiliensis TaxID=1658108 RepID=UPI0006B614EF|nr:tape measure protein [Niameybacter massiliensis]